jgi:hypothetical protein
MTDVPNPTFTVSITRSGDWIYSARFVNGKGSFYRVSSVRRRGDASPMRLVKYLTKSDAVKAAKGAAKIHEGFSKQMNKGTLYKRLILKECVPLAGRFEFQEDIDLTLTDIHF